VAQKNRGIQKTWHKMHYLCFKVMIQIASAGTIMIRSNTDNIYVRC